MNVLTLGSRVIGIEPAVECSLAFLGATFSGEPRHQRRLDKVLAIEAAARASDCTDRPAATRLTGAAAPLRSADGPVRPPARRAPRVPAAARRARDDFDAFWSHDPRRQPRRSRAPAVAVDVDSHLETIGRPTSRSPGSTASRSRPGSFGPRARPGPLPTIVEYIGYGGGRGRPVDWLRLGVGGLRAPRDGHARPGRRAGDRATPSDIADDRHRARVPGRDDAGSSTPRPTTTAGS